MPIDGQPPTSDVEGHDATLRGDVLCATEVCGNEIDEDCDGVIDECPSGTECIARLCQDITQGSCATNLNCETDEICDDGQCTPYRTTSCGGGETCTGKSHCTTVAVCSNAPACLGSAGSACVEQCDCGGELICEAESGTCVQCLNNGQCRGEDACNGSGHCMGNTLVASGSLATVQKHLLEQIDTCLGSATGRRSIGCTAMAFQQPFEIDGQVVDRLTLTGLLTVDPCSTILSLTDVRPALIDAFGCNTEESRHVIWNNGIDTRSAPAACLLYLPYVDIDEGDATRWAVWFGPCDQAAGATF